MGVSVLAGLASLQATETVEGGSAHRLIVATFVGAILVYVVAQYQSPDGVAAALGAIATLVGLMALAVTAGLLAGWSPLFSIPALVVGALLLGSVTNGMLLGHWYLNQPGLKPWALARLTNGALVVTALSAVIGLASGPRLLGARTEGAALGLPGFGDGFGSQFFFVWIGLIAFTGAVVWAVKRCIDIRSIQSATGLYYVAILTAGVAEFLVRYLMVDVA